jgi:hypothetical protein
MDERRKAESFQRTLAAFWRTIGDALGGYRPERHYMRGPGPKWREKHGISEQGTAPWLLAAASPPQLVRVPTRSNPR